MYPWSSCEKHFPVAVLFVPVLIHSFGCQLRLRSPTWSGKLYSFCGINRKTDMPVYLKSSSAISGSKEILISYLSFTDSLENIYVRREPSGVQRCSDRAVH